MTYRMMATEMIRDADQSCSSRVVPVGFISLAKALVFAVLEVADQIKQTAPILEDIRDNTKPKTSWG